MFLCHAIPNISPLLQVFLRSSSLLREDQAGWMQVMLTIMEASVAANRWFLYLCFADSKGLSAQTWETELRPDDDMLDNYLVWCDYVSPYPPPDMHATTPYVGT